MCQSEGMFHWHIGTLLLTHYHIEKLLIMKILILGAGKMGSFFTDLLSFEHEVAVLENDPKRMRFMYNALRLQKPEEVAEFKPELVINCVTLSYTIEAFKNVMPYLQPYCIISDIASVKTHLKEFYETCGFP